MELKTNTGSAVTISDATFGRDFNEALVHQVVTAYMAGARQGTKAQKTRAEVRGGGRKPFRQKGTGNARQGTIRAPHMVGGGVVFGPTTARNYSYKLPKKVRRLALRSALSSKVKEDSLVILESIALKSYYIS